MSIFIFKVKFYVPTCITCLKIPLIDDFSRQILIRSASLDAVSHALSDSVLFNEFVFHFLLENFDFPSFELIHIATRFLSPNFQKFSKIYVSVNSPHFSASAGILWKKKQPKICGEKIRKTRCSYNFDQVKSTFFPFDFFLLKINRFEKILSWYSDRANLNVYILIDRPIQVEKEEMKIH